MEDTSGADNLSSIEIQAFDAALVNLEKAENVWSQIRILSEGTSGRRKHLIYDLHLKEYNSLLASLPTIDGWKPTSELSFEDVERQRRLEDTTARPSEDHTDDQISTADPSEELSNYRYRLERERRMRIRDELETAIEKANSDLVAIRSELGSKGGSSRAIPNATWANFRATVRRIVELLGPGSRNKPPLWTDFLRHLKYGQTSDLACIEERDWPAVKKALRKQLYGPNEPLPSQFFDLGRSSKLPERSPKIPKFRWVALSGNDFERLIFEMMSSDNEYECVELLTNTNAPDRGRDLSAFRIVKDKLTGSSRQRIVIQCKHWLSRSIGSHDVSQAVHQTDFWSNPPVDILIIATSGRFTSDAVSWVEAHRAAVKSPTILLWPETHLEQMLGDKPSLIEQFGLRA